MPIHPVCAMLDAILTQLLHPGRPDVFGDTAGLRVSKLLERFIGYRGPLGTIAAVNVPDNCSWQPTLHSDHVELLFINPPVLTVEKSVWFFEFDVEARLDRVDLYITHLIAAVRVMRRNREERFEIDWRGP